MQASASNLPLEGMAQKQLLRTPGAHTLYLFRHWWRWEDISLRMATYVWFSSLNCTVLCFQNSSQLTSSHRSTPESIYKSLPAGIVTSGQPCIKHLSELIFRSIKLCPNAVQSSSPHFQFEPNIVPLWSCVHNSLQHTTKVIWSQLVSWMIRNGTLW